MSDIATPSENRYDVVIIGGGFAGSSSAILLKRFNPDAKVLIIERATAFKKKVGEATVELSSFFLHHVLGLYDHLSRAHLPKHGLRYWFTDGQNRRLSDMSEVGSFELPRLPAFQLNRPVLDEHLLNEAANKGADVRRGVRIQDIQQGWPESRIRFSEDGLEREVVTSWIIDASGREGVLASRLETRRYFDEMTTSSIWARFSGVLDMDAPDNGLFDADMPRIAAARRLATNHFCGYGWWCWVIPLSDGQTSIGLVYDQRLFDPGLGDGGAKIAFLRFLSSQPGLRELTRNANMTEGDFNLRHRLAYTTDAYAGKGWALVADAATFLDPFYSPGLDHAATSVFATAKLIAATTAAAGGRLTRGESPVRAQNKETAVGVPTGPAEPALDSALAAHNAMFARSIRRWLDGLYVDKYEIMGDAELMRCSFLVDTALYYVGVVAPVIRNPDAIAHPIFGLALPQTCYAAAFMRFFKSRLVKIARIRRQTGRYGRRNIGWRPYGRAFDLGWPSISILLRGLSAWTRLELDTLRHRLTTRKIDVSKRPAGRRSTLDQPAP